MNKFKRLLIIPILLLALALPLILSSCAMDYKVSEVICDNLIKKAKTIESSSGTGKYAIDSSVTTCWSPKTAGGDWLDIVFKSDVTFNAVAIKEKESAVKVFKLQVPDGDGWKTIYYSDGIGKYRLCSFEQVTTSRLRFVVDNAFNKFSIRELSVYNIDNQPLESFQKTAFINVANYKDMLATRPSELNEYLSFYDDIVLTNAVIADANGNLDLTVGVDELTAIIAHITAQNTAKASINIINNAAVNPIKTKPDCDNLIANLIKLCNDTGANGLALHWKELVGAELWRAYNFLIDNLSKQIAKTETETTEALSLSIILENAHAELEKKTCKALNKVYFFGSPAVNYTEVYNDFYNNFYFAINLLHSIGFDKSKIVVTISLFAHSVSNHTETMPYSSLVDSATIVNQWQNLYISQQYNGAYRDFYFQSVVLAHDKAVYARTLRLGGFGIVGLAYDMPMTSNLSITAAIAKVLG